MGRTHRLLSSPHALSVLVGLLGQGSLVVSGPLLARSLGPTQRGLLALYSSGMLIAVQICSLGLPLAVTFETARRNATSRSIVKHNWRHGAAISLGGGLGCLVLLEAFSAARPDLGLTQRNTVVSAALAVLVVVLQLSMAALQGAHRFTSLNVLRLIPTVGFTLLMAVYFVVRTKHHLEIVLYLYVLTAGLGALIAVLLCLVVHVDELQEESADAKLGRDVIRRGVRGLLGSSTPVDTLTLDQTLVGTLLSPHSLGIYSVANSFSNLPSILTSSLGIVAVPEGARLTDPGEREVWLRRTRRRALLLVIGCVVLTELVVGPMTRILFGSDFHDSVFIARLLAPAGGILAFRRLQAALVQSAGLAGRASVAEALALATLLVMLVVLLPLAGLVGAAIAVLGAGVVSNAYLWRQTSLLLRTGPPT